MKQILACDGVKSIAICCCLLLIACSSQPIQQPPMENEVGQHSLIQSREVHNLKLAGGIEVEISNLYGDIHVRESTEGGIRIELFIQRTRESLATQNLSQKMNSKLMTIRVEPDSDDEEGHLLRIDLVAMVPRAPRLRLITEEGTIEAKKLHNPLIEAWSTDGEVRLTATSIMHARTENGDIRATLMQPGWHGEHQLFSKTGHIQAFVPLGPDLSLNARAGKSLRSEFKLDISDNGDLYFAETINGSGKDAIVIQSTKGKVELFSLVFDPRIFGPPSITSPQSN